MDKQTVFAKTPKGTDEADNRTYKLNMRLRTALLMVNGTDSVEVMAKKFHGIDQVNELLQELLADGYIVQIANFNQVARTIVSRIHELLGPDGDVVTERIEKMSTQPNASVMVAQFLQQRREMFESIAGKQKTTSFFEEVNRLLS
ncbi:MAG: hypothetical protein HY308_16965 [Gammaproteobacteria bacterium]|nr:hypothetical protein [Gammaproteobacteria bacterium]